MEQLTDQKIELAAETLWDSLRAKFGDTTEWIFVNEAIKDDYRKAVRDVMKALEAE